MMVPNIAATAARNAALKAGSIQQHAKRNPLASFGSVADVHKFPTPTVEECKPGLEPVSYNVVVVPTPIAQDGQAPKIGNVHLADETSDRLEMAMQMGRIIAVAPLAFNYDKWPKGARLPSVGDIVWFAKHSGGPFVGMDGRDYRLILDKDVNAVIQRA
jgi:co-chaperonin GroES (HSP10)